MGPVLHGERVEARGDVKISQTTKNDGPAVIRAAGHRPTAKSQETRARLIEGTIRTLVDHGIGAVTTRRIASAAGVQLATLHYHFDSKEALLLAALEALNAEMIERSLTSIDRGDSLEARLRTVIRASWRHVAATRDVQIAQIELTLYALRTKGAEWLAARQYRTYVAYYADMLSDAEELPERQRGEIAEAIGRFVLCGIDGLILQSLALADTAATERGVEALVVASTDYLRRLVAEA